MTIVLSALVGLYSGINLSGILHHQIPEKTDNVNTKLDEETSALKTELSVLKSQVETYKSKARTLEKDYAAAINKVHTLEHDAPCDPTHVDDHQRPPENPNPHPVCQHLFAPIPTALSLWGENIQRILEATRLPNDTKFKFHDFTAELLQIITPRLYRSVKTLPHDWRSVERAMNVAWERYQYLQLSKNERSQIDTPPRPLKILVMGGSLLVGTNCRKLLTELGLSFRLPKRDCTWSNRLMSFLNSFAKSDVVEVTKVAMGGTNTATGNVIWQYDLIPEEARNPDIVINTYSTNDMHILTILEAQSSNVTLRDKVFEMTQEFARNVLQTCDPNKAPPLFLHVDDYLGNEQRSIWDTTELSQGVQVLASYYGFASFSYADVVREIVYGDTKEAWLSANWWETGSFEREIHPGMGMHIASTWVIVYNLLNLVTTYCSLPPKPSDYSIQEYKVGYLGLPPLRGDTKPAENKPAPHPEGLPPILTKELLIEDVTKHWKEAASKLVPCDANTKHSHSKCPFSWVSGLSLQQNNETWIQEYFQGRSKTWDGWILGNDGGKLGFTPNERQPNNSTKMVLEFEFTQSIRSTTMFYMKSYGEKWKNSELQFQVKKAGSVGEAELLERRLLPGSHDKQTSEMYTEELKFAEAIPVGSKIQIEAFLSGGTMFKIMGLAICS